MYLYEEVSVLLLAKLASAVLLAADALGRISVTGSVSDIRSVGVIIPLNGLNLRYAFRGHYPVSPFWLTYEPLSAATSHARVHPSRYNYVGNLGSRAAYDSFRPGDW